jgi:hypothetical protein
MLMFDKTLFNAHTSFYTSRKPLDRVPMAIAPNEFINPRNCLGTLPIIWSFMLAIPWPTGPNAANRKDCLL